MNFKTLMTSLLTTSLLAAPAMAQEEAAPAATETGVKFSGFVDASVFAVLASEVEDPEFFDGFALGLDQVELDVEAAVTGDLTVRTDLNFFPGAGAASFDSLVEQAYAEYSMGDSGFFVQVGKRNAPIGIEALDPVDMYQYSQGLIFAGATPSNLNGVFFGWSDGAISALAWGTNDWDTPKVGGKPSAGARFEYAFDAGHVGLSSTYSLATEALMVDTDAKAGFGDFTAFLEGNYGSAADVDTTGFLVKGNYALSEDFSATLRYDMLTVGEEASSSASAAVLLTLAEGLSGCAEVRMDMGDAPYADMTTAAFEIIGAF